MGYKGVQSALDAIAKKALPAYVDTGATAVTKANMNDAKIKGLLDPMTLKK
jgi:ribose transport system substrate-binding protein